MSGIMPPIPPSPFPRKGETGVRGLRPLPYEVPQ